MMNKLSEKVKSLIETFKGKSRKFKIIVCIATALVLAGLILLGVSLGRTKYEVLFSNMDTADSGAVVAKLKEKKVDVQVKGSNILVPKGQVDQLRMELVSEVPMTNGSQGFELMDKSQFGQTDAEMQVNYQRALQGELERTIKSFQAVDNARVHLVMPQDSAFVKDSQPAKASVILKLKPGQKMTDDQVKSIMALVSGSVKNLSKENVEVVDDKMTLLSKDLGTDSKIDGASSVEKQQSLKSQYEKDMEKKVLDMLETVYGKNKVKVKINADLSFDAVEKNTTSYDPGSVVVSEHTVKDTNNGGTANTSTSPVDNNSTNSQSTANNNGTATHEEKTTNYNISKVDDKTIKAPGEVRRLTTSVVLDGNIDAATRNSVNNLVVSAVGFDTKRGDSISVEGIPFDTALKDSTQKDIDAMNKEAQKAKQMKLYKEIGAGAVALIVAIIAAIILIKKRKPQESEDEFLEPKGLDVIINDSVDEKKQEQLFKPIDFEEQNERIHMENEVRKYAKDKPDQVAEIIKAWIADDER